MLTPIQQHAVDQFAKSLPARAMARSWWRRDRVRRRIVVVFNASTSPMKEW
jgi:hypothetical protein